MKLLGEHFDFTIEAPATEVLTYDLNGNINTPVRKGSNGFHPINVTGHGTLMFDGPIDEN